ncbi:hypothetical protein K2Q00_00310 [Patescibacteria group bacterium]|nr:hypothetical protein [Patescibacteria group bacterium]
MRRRNFLLAGVAAATLGLNPVLADDRFFHWRKPGGDPYRGTLDDALRAFGDLFARDPDVTDELRRKVQQNQGTQSLVFENWQVTRMMFGATQQVPNVIVDPSDLAAWGNASRRMTMYTAQRHTGGEARFYAIFRPEVCNNWCIKLGARECILDLVLCDQGCTQLKAKQYRG